MVRLRHGGFALALATTALAIVGCGAAGPRATTATTTTEHEAGYVAGVVVASPSCPVVRHGIACRLRPVAGVTVEVTEAGTVVASGRTDGLGQFRLACPQGRAFVVVRNDNGLGSETRHEVVVVPGGTTSVTLPLDIGIR